MNDISEHCLCDHCSGQDCNIFTDEEKERDQREHDAAIKAEATATENKRICKWVQDEDGTYQTDCGNAFVLNNEDSLSDNRFKYCTFCGEILQESRRSHP